MSFAVDARRAGIPVGYYGNVVATPVAISTARDLCSSPLSYAVELVRKAKLEVTMEYMRSMADITVLHKRRSCSLPSTCMYFVTDATRANFRDLDFGWGKPVYGGTAEAGAPMSPWKLSIILPLKNARGEDAIAVPMYLPAPAMEKAVKEVGNMLRAPANDDAMPQQTKRSAL